MAHLPFLLFDDAKVRGFQIVTNNFVGFLHENLSFVDINQVLCTHTPKNTLFTVCAHSFWGGAILGCGKRTAREGLQHILILYKRG